MAAKKKTKTAKKKRKKLIIIGGGFSGTYVAKKLEKKFDVTLIDTKEYFEFTPSILRTIVEPWHSYKIQVRHKDYLNYTNIIVGKVESFTDKAVLVNKKKYAFDYLVIASGSSYKAPFKGTNVVVASRAKTLVECYQALKDAKDVLVIGGGIVGIELIGEITDHYKNKRVILVHAKDRVLERNSKKVQNYATKFLEKRGVEIIYDEYVVGKEKEGYKTKSGKVFKADMVFLCTGIKSNAGFFKGKFSKLLTERNQVMVNDYLQTIDYPHIFAAGDITAIQEEKLAQTAEQQAKIIVRNLCALERNQALQPYKSKPKPILLSLGKHKGVLIYKRIELRGIIPALMKPFVEWKVMRMYR